MTGRAPAVYHYREDYTSGLPSAPLFDLRKEASKISRSKLASNNQLQRCGRIILRQGDRRVQLAQTDDGRGIIKTVQEIGGRLSHARYPLSLAHKPIAYSWQRMVYCALLAITLSATFMYAVQHRWLHMLFRQELLVLLGAGTLVFAFLALAVYLYYKVGFEDISDRKYITRTYEGLLQEEGLSPALIAFLSAFYNDALITMYGNERLIAQLGSPPEYHILHPQGSDGAARQQGLRLHPGTPLYVDWDKDGHAVITTSQAFALQTDGGDVVNQLTSWFQMRINVRRGFEHAVWHWLKNMRKVPIQVESIDIWHTWSDTPPAVLQQAYGALDYASVIDSEKVLALKMTYQPLVTSRVQSSRVRAALLRPVLARQSSRQRGDDAETIYSPAPA